MNTLKSLKSRILLTSIIVAVLCVSVVAWAADSTGPLENGATYEEGYIQFNIKNLHIDSFFAVLLDQDGRVYLPLSKVLTGLELKFGFDLANGQVSGLIPQLNEFYVFDIGGSMLKRGGLSIPVSQGKYRVANGEIYVTVDFIREWLPVEVEWDEFLLEVAIFPKFQLASEILAEREQLREKLLALRGMEDVVQARQIPPSVFSPGIYRYQVNMSGGLQGLRGPELTLGYVGPVLYGDFVGQVELSPAGVKLQTVQLKYRDVGSLKEISLGNSLLELPALLSPSMVIQGVRLQNMDDRYKYGATDLKGIVPPDSDVELFYQGMLVSYQRVPDGAYHFQDVPVRGAYNVYDLVVCTPEGHIYREKQYVVAGDQQLTAGKYHFLGGAGFTADGLAGAGQVYYGVTDGLTVSGLWTLLPRTKEKPQDNYLGSEALVKLNPATMLFAGGHYGLNSQEVKYRAGIKSVPGSWILKGGVTGSTVEGSEVELEVEKGFDRQKLAMVYRLDNYAKKISHQIETRYQSQVNMNLYFRLQNVLAFGATGWSDLISGNFSYAGWPQVDVHADSQLVVNAQGLSSYGLYIDLLSKRRLQVPLSYSLGAQLGKNRYDLTGSIQYQLNDWLKLRGTVGLTQVNVSLSIGESRRLAWPMPKVKSEFFAMGWVEGRVYLDENGNQVYDAGEQVFKGVNILVNDQPQAVTGEDGSYILQGLKPYQNVKIGVDATTVDALYLPVTEDEVVELRPGAGLQLDFGLATCSGLSGQILGLGELGHDVGPVAVVLLDMAGQEMYRTRPEYDGFFIMEQIQPGEYWLQVIFENAPVGKTLTPAQYRIEIPYGAMPVWYDGLLFKLLNG